LPAQIDFAAVFITFLVLLFSLTVHEAAHALTADRLGDPTARLLGRVSLNPAVHVDPLGTIVLPLIAIISNFPVLGWAKPVPVNITRLRGHWKRKYMLIAAAGPASNLVLAVLGSLVLHLVPVSGALQEATLAPLAELFREVVFINVLLAVFNMVPVPPLDGGNVLAGLLPRNLAALFDQIRPYGFLLLYALILTNGFDMLVGPPYNFLLSWMP